MAFLEEMDGRYRAGTLDAPGGWIVMESYNDWLVERREPRRQAGVWSEVPDPAPLPIAHKHEEYLSGLRAQRRWKDHFSVKRKYARAKAVLRGTGPLPPNRAPPPPKSTNNAKSVSESIF